MTPEQIAKGLTEAQRRAVLSLGNFIGLRWPCEFAGPYRDIRAQTLNRLAGMGLVWGKENYISRFAGLLPLGLEVRAILEQQP